MENEPIKPYIITDPYYISDGKYSKEFPYNTTNPNTNQLITVYGYEGTSNGSGSFTYEDQEVATDEGALCIAHCKEGWNEEFGATFFTLYDAKNAFDLIIRHF